MREAHITRELVIRTANRVGLLAEVAKLLSDKGINIISVFVEVEGDEAVLHLITDAQLHARDALREAEYPLEENEVVAIELPNRPGLLRRVTEALARQDLDIKYLYATASERSERSLVIFSCSNNGKAVLLLRAR